MTAVKIIMVIISSLLIGAHFFRWGYYPLVIVSLLFPLLLALRRPWATGVLQLLLLLAGIEWIRTLIMLVSERRTAGMQWTRLSVILGSVAAFTIVSAIVTGFNKKK